MDYRNQAAAGNQYPSETPKQLILGDIGNEIAGAGVQAYEISDVHSTDTTPPRA